MGGNSTSNATFWLGVSNLKTVTGVVALCGAEVSAS